MIVTTGTIDLANSIQKKTKGDLSFLSHESQYHSLNLICNSFSPHRREQKGESELKLQIRTLTPQASLQKNGKKIR